MCFVVANFLYRLSQLMKHLLEKYCVFDNCVGVWMLLLVVGIDDKILVTFVLMLDGVEKASAWKMNGVLKGVKVDFEHIPCLLFQSAAVIDLQWLCWIFMNCFYLT